VKPHDRSWLKLLAFFVVTTLASSLVFAAVLAGVTIAVAGGQAPQLPDDSQVDPVVPGRIFFGTITDAHCGARHKDSDQGASECVRMCARNGSRYVLVGNDGSYELAGDMERFSALAGRRVNLVGVLHGDSIKVSSASLQGSNWSYNGGRSNPQ
jgi:hypothetical protein